MYCIVAIEVKKDGVYIILLEFIPLHHVILLNALLCSYELNTLDAGRSRLMCGVIVVDAELFWSTCHGRDAYIHDHYLRYRHNFALFYQLLNSNLFTHRMRSFKREASSENYGPRVYSYHIIFRSIKQKTQKYLAAIYLPLLYFALLFIFYTYLYQFSSLQVIVKGLTTPLSRWVQVFVCLCRCNHW